jgi:hypothetical protein
LRSVLWVRRGMLVGKEGEGSYVLLVQGSHGGGDVGGCDEVFTMLDT